MGTHLHRAMRRRYLNSGDQPSLRSSLSAESRQMTWHWKIAWNRDDGRTDGRIRVDRRVFRGKRSTLARRAAPSRYRSVHVRGAADEWSRSPRYGPVTRDVIYNPHRSGVEGLYVITSGTFPLSFLFLFFFFVIHFRPPVRSRLRAINLWAYVWYASRYVSHRLHGLDDNARLNSWRAHRHSLMGERERLMRATVLSLRSAQTSVYGRLGENTPAHSPLHVSSRGAQTFNYLPIMTVNWGRRFACQIGLDI